MTGSSRALVLAAGLIGASGVALAAAASHLAGDAGLQTAALLLVIHAAALTGLASLADKLPGAGRLFAFGGAALALGAALFAADLSARAFMATRLFPGAAPTGGFLMIGGWLLVAVAAAFRRNGD